MATLERSYRRAGIAAYVLIIVLFVATYLQGYIYSAGQLLDLYNLSIVAGVTAYVIFLSQFLLSARIRWIERLFGQDLLLQAHGFLGMMLAGLVAFHGFVKFTYLGPNRRALLGIAAFVIYAVLAPAALLILQGRAKRRVGSPRYERAKVSHNLLVVAAILVVIHVQQASSTYSVLLRSLTLGWAVICLSAYVYHKFIRPRRLQTVTVGAVEERGQDLVTIKMAPADEEADGSGRLKNENRRPGQFYYYRFQSGAIGPEEHPFTVVSAPGEPVQLIARKVGDFTSALAGVQPGDRVTLDGPYGRFVPPKSTDTPIYLIAGGIGITPMISMIRDADTRSNRPVSLIWSVRDESDLAAAREIDEFASEINRWIFITGTDGAGRTAGAPQTGTTDARISGRVDAERLDEIIPGERRSRARFYVCGPASFIQSTTENLKKLGVKKRNIHSERFSWR